MESEMIFLVVTLSLCWEG